MLFLNLLFFPFSYRVEKFKFKSGITYYLIDDIQIHEYMYTTTELKQNSLNLTRFSASLVSKHMFQLQHKLHKSLLKLFRFFFNPVLFDIL